MYVYVIMHIYTTHIHWLSHIRARGRVASPRTQTTGERMGFAYVDMASESDAQARASRPSAFPPPPPWERAEPVSFCLNATIYYNVLWFNSLIYQCVVVYNC